MTATKMDNGVADCSVSSTLTTHRTPRLCNSKLTTFAIPSLPKLHGKAALVTTKLCEPIYKSTTPYVFNLSTPKEYITSTLMEYNSLHDPYLKSYFYQPTMQTKLTKNGFINDKLDVICSLRKYNAYRHFLENEFLKMYKKQVEENNVKNHCVVEPAKENPKVKEREEKRKQFFLQQEKKLRTKQVKLRKMEMEEERMKQRATEKRRLEKEKTEMKREAEREQRRITKMQKEYLETLRRKKLLARADTVEYSRLVQLHELKQKERMKHIKELEDRWEKYEKHAQFASEEEEKKKKEVEEEKERRLRRREKLFRILQQREEQRKTKILEENHQQVEQLKEEADKFENHWKEIHDSQLMDCREKMKKQHELWNQQQRKLSHKTSVSCVTDANSHQKMSVNYSSDLEHLKMSLGKNVEQKQRKPSAEQQSLVLEPILIAVANHTAKELPLEVIDEEEVDGENVNQNLSTSETEGEVDDIEQAGVSNGNEKTDAEAENGMNSSTIIENENTKLLTMGVDTEVDSPNITTDDGGRKNDVEMSEIKNIEEGSDLCINATLSAKNSINQSTDEPNVGVGKLDASSSITNSSCLRSESSTRSDSVESVSSRPKSVRFDLP